MAIPVIASSGTVAAKDGLPSEIDVPYPSGINAGDLLVCLYSISSAQDPTTPDGWTLEGLAGANAETAMFSKIATGSESGTLFLDTNSSQTQMARMHRITGANSFEGNTTNSGNGKVLTHPDITTTGPDRLILVCGGIDDDETAVSFTGETGGDLTLHTTDITALGTDHCLYLQTAGMASAGTISGGSWSFQGASENWAHVAAAVYATGSLIYKPHPFNEMLKR